MPAVRFVFDVISPYAYVAWKLVRDRGMVPVPILFAAVLDALGQKGPAEIPAKRVYAFKDAYRKGARAGEPEAKERLRAATAEAIAAGVFGVPSFVTGGEVFWGVDAIPHLDEFLAGRDPVPADAAARWKDLPATARRPRSATS